MSGRRNGDYGGGGDFQDDQAEESVSEKRAKEYVRALLAERLIVEEFDKCPLATKLIDEEIAKAEAEGRGPKRDQKYVDIYYEKPVRIATKVLVPVKDNPKFNFVGKILGPKGNSLKRLQEDTMCRMAILGRGSMRDKAKEQEFRQSLDIKYAHLNDELHVEVSALASPAEAYARIAFALTELQKFLIPDGSDDISKSQLQEMGLYEERPPKPRSRPPALGGAMRRPAPGAQGPPPSTRPPAARAPTQKVPLLGSRGPPGKPRPALLERPSSYPSGQNSFDRNFEDSYRSEMSYDDYSPSGPSRSNYGGNRAPPSDYDDFYGNDANDSQDRQQWRQHKSGGYDGRPSGPRSEQPRFRSTPYSRPLNRS